LRTGDLADTWRRGHDPAGVAPLQDDLDALVEFVDI
jgi:hypothetical protein